jgi:hypothetical protein
VIESAGNIDEDKDQMEDIETTGAQAEKDQMEDHDIRTIAPPVPTDHAQAVDNNTDVPHA